MTPITIPFGELKRQSDALQPELNAAIARVVASGWYILGPEVQAFEDEFAAYCGATHAIGVASGAEALYLALVALDVGPGDEVITVANACMYQIAAILQAGALPVLVDVDPHTHTMDPAACAAAITSRTRAILPVHLYGRLADMVALTAIAERHGLAVIEDAAQAHGAWRLDGAGQVRRAGAWGHIACFSFYPSKNLGALGDAGALTTRDAAIAERLRRLRFYGWGQKYVTTELGGRNSRLDELQAAILRVKLRHLDAWNNARRDHAAHYVRLLANSRVTTPADEPGHVYHLYVVTSATRDQLRTQLLAAGIGCDIHYPLPTHLHPAYANLGYQVGDLPYTEQLAQHILTLPLYAEIRSDEVAAVAHAVRGA